MKLNAIIKRSLIPTHSLLQQEKDTFHYVDSFQSLFSNNGQVIPIETIGGLFITSGPAWADSLMTLRDKIAGKFGLKTAAGFINQAKLSGDRIMEPGERLGMFKLYGKTENELILGEEDKHLKFRVSILTDDEIAHKNRQYLMITTAVEFTNLFGRIYFFPVKPFHQLIVRTTLKRMVKQIGNKQRH